MTAKSATELKALQERVAELEKQLKDLRSRLNGSQPQQNWRPRPMTEEEEIAYHESSEWVRKYIEKEREADRKRVNAAIDRQIEKEKKAAARKAKTGTKTRKAG
jgi:hypothetical protein